MELSLTISEVWTSDCICVMAVKSSRKPMSYARATFPHVRLQRLPQALLRLGDASSSLSTPQAGVVGGHGGMLLSRGSRVLADDPCSEYNVQQF